MVLLPLYIRRECGSATMGRMAFFSRFRSHLPGVGDFDRGLSTVSLRAAACDGVFRTPAQPAACASRHSRRRNELVFAPRFGR
jgi:hypothetical protein